MSRIQWGNVSKEDYEVIFVLAERGVEMATRFNVDIDKTTAVMDLAVAHMDVGLDLQAMQTATDADFGHDFFGIHRHLSRETGKLQGCFMPRLARRAA